MKPNNFHAKPAVSVKVERQRISLELELVVESDFILSLWGSYYSMVSEELVGQFCPLESVAIVSLSYTSAWFVL